MGDDVGTWEGTNLITEATALAWHPSPKLLVMRFHVPFHGPPPWSPLIMVPSLVH